MLGFHLNCLKCYLILKICIFLGKKSSHLAFGRLKFFCSLFQYIVIFQNLGLSSITKDMHSSSKNLQYDMIHKQSLDRLLLYTRKAKDVEDDKCLLCNTLEDAKHLLISYRHKLGIWDGVFKKFLGYSTTVNYYQIYQSIANFNLNQYIITTLYLTLISRLLYILELFSFIMKIIWKHHYLQIIENVSIDINKVCKYIHAELMKFPNLKNKFIY